MNTAAIALCHRQFAQAKVQLDSVLEKMDLRIVVTENDSRHMLPPFLINILIYFFLVVKNYKMARRLAKHSRFVLDTNHIDPTQIPQQNMMP